MGSMVDAIDDTKEVLDGVGENDDTKVFLDGVREIEGEEVARECERLMSHRSWMDRLLRRTRRSLIDVLIDARNRVDRRRGWFKEIRRFQAMPFSSDRIDE